MFKFFGSPIISEITHFSFGFQFLNCPDIVYYWVTILFQKKSCRKFCWSPATTKTGSSKINWVVQITDNYRKPRNGAAKLRINQPLDFGYLSVKFGGGQQTWSCWVAHAFSCSLICCTPTSAQPTPILPTTTPDNLNNKQAGQITTTSGGCQQRGCTTTTTTSWFRDSNRGDTPEVTSQNWKLITVGICF